jgi:prepilin-type N-terminal cleavage/methylation domain-containing protein
MTTTRAFTMIEMMIAITLGALVVYTAIAAIRVAANAMTTAQRMATENSMLRIGVEAAVDEADYWIGSDDPEPGRPKPLRAFDAQGGGRAFTDFRDANFFDGGGSQTSWSAGNRLGWNSSPLAWAPCDPRTWCRANVAEEHSPRSYWGNFSVYANIDNSRAWHTWHASQIRGIVDTLGFYGLFEYLPSNGFAVYHAPRSNSAKTPKGASTNISYGGMVEALTVNGRWLCPTDGGDNTMKGRIRNTNGSRYYLPGPQAATAADSRRLAKIGYEARSSTGGYTSDGETHQVLRGFLDTTRTNQELMRSNGTLVAPTHWPEVTYRVHRFIERGHPVTLCVVEMTSPLTGAQVALPFTTVATTLRGARQQRKPTSGWADPFGELAEQATLDYAVTP